MIRYKKSVSWSRERVNGVQKRSRCWRLLLDDDYMGEDEAVEISMQKAGDDNRASVGICECVCVCV